MNDEKLKIWWSKHSVCPRCRTPIESTYEAAQGITPYHNTFKCTECRYLGLAYELLPKPSEADEWYRMHSRCPECGEVPESTTIGVIHVAGKEFFDDVNTSQCRCGWEGMIYQLVE